MNATRISIIVGILLLLGYAGLSFYPTVKSQIFHAQLVAERRPLKVASADEFARKAVPGWSRAEELGLVLPLNITHEFAEHNLRLQITKAWLTGREGYLLVTTDSADGKHLVLNSGWIEGPDGKRINEAYAYRMGATTKLGLSADGMHSIIVIPDAADMNIDGTVSLIGNGLAWANEHEGETYDGSGSKVTLKLPWRELMRKEPQSSVLVLNQQGEWLGRSLALERLDVAVGRMTLTGRIILPDGEFDPELSSILHVGDAVREQQEFTIEPGGRPEEYQFTVVYDGPDAWPAKVRLDVKSISFGTEQVLEWPFAYSPGAEHELLPVEQQHTVRFYDQDLRLIISWGEGADVEYVPVEAKAPHVRAALYSGGRGEDRDRPGFEVIGPDGVVISNMGGGVGTIYDAPGTRLFGGLVEWGGDNREGVTVRWVPERMPPWKAGDPLLLRNHEPGGRLMIEENWELASESVAATAGVHRGGED